MTAFAEVSFPQESDKVRNQNELSYLEIVGNRDIKTPVQAPVKS